MAAEGADVAVVSHSDVAAAEQVAGEIRELGRRAVAVKADITDRESVEGMIGTVCDALGTLDVLVNNAGYTAHGPLEQLSEADWDAVFAVNAKGTFLCSVAAARRMIPAGRGSIVNIAGASAHRSYPFAGGYGPAKAAVVNLTRQMSLEWAKHGIRVNGVSPGPIREAGSGWETREPELAEEVRRLPLRQAADPVDVARAVAFLASPHAASTTGHMLLVDGGGVNTWYLAPQDYAEGGG
ncbi:MAG: SDR family oxidoreductase [Bauldia sp.]|nr:SDR family oxidoreductase [Bauldia sp.]